MNGSEAKQWGLKPNKYVPVTAITLLPSMWEGRNKLSHQSPGVVLVIKGARDTLHSTLALFPEVMRSDFHPVRKTIEAYSNNGTIAGGDEASACGLLIGQTYIWDALVRVADADGEQAEYRIDRWD